jgi:hypothetical protein
MAPREAKTWEDICHLPRDNVAASDYWMILDRDTVRIAAQQCGQVPTQKITLPRAVFEAFIDWYNTGRCPESAAQKLEPDQMIPSRSSSGS